MSFANLTKHNGQNSVGVAMAASGNNRLLVVVTQQSRNPVTLASVRVNGAAGGTTLVSTNTDDPNIAGTVTYFIDSELPSSAGTYTVEPADSGGAAADGSMQIYYAENANQSPLIASSLGAFANPSGQTRTAALSATATDLQVAAYSGNAPTAVVGVVDYAGSGGSHFISAQSDSDIEFTTNYIASASIAASFASISAAPVFSVDSVSGGDQPGESWVFALSNASGSGMTANIGGTALTVTAQTSGSITVTIPDPLTFDGGIYRFSENLTVQIVDGANSDTIATPITPATGYTQFQAPDPLTGVWASAEFADAISPQVLAPGDYGWCLEPADSDAAGGYFPENSVIPFRFMDMSDPTPAWGSEGTITVTAASGDGSSGYALSITASITFDITEGLTRG